MAKSKKSKKESAVSLDTLKNFRAEIALQLAQSEATAAKALETLKASRRDARSQKAMISLLNDLMRECSPPT